MRERRVHHEMQFLAKLAEENAGGILVHGWERHAGADVAHVTLLDTPAYGADGVARRHELRLVLPEYFPCVPVEAYLERAVVHPNVHPVSGFICLWARHAAGDTVIEALLQTQRVISWGLWNADPDHVMQPGLGELASLVYTPLRVPPEYAAERAPAPPLARRQRLTV